MSITMDEARAMKCEKYTGAVETCLECSRYGDDCDGDDEMSE